MSSTQRPNVEIVSRIYDALKQRDIPTAFELLSPQVEIVQSEEVPWGGTYRGHEEALRFFTKLVETITSAVTFDRLIDAGDHVVAIGRTQGTVNQNGASFDVPIAHVWTLRDGVVTRVLYCIDNPTMTAALRRAV